VENFFASEHVDQFMSFHPQSYLGLDTQVAKVFESEEHSELLNSVEGEGTCKPHGSCRNTDSNFFALDPKTVPKLGNLRFGNSKTGRTD
jgi:hypothetical protein